MCILYVLCTQWIIGRPRRLACIRMFHVLNQLMDICNTTCYESALKVGWYGFHSFFSPYGSTALWTLAAFSVSLLLYTVGMTDWTGDKPVARPLPTHRIKAHRHPCLEWDSNPRPSVQADEDGSCLRPRGQCDRRYRFIITCNSRDYPL
jgi:hypothetical protein